MPVTEVRVGDLLTSRAQTLVNTVNCVGVMGKGIAAAFKKRFPQMFDDYVAHCERGEVQLGRPYLWRGDAVWVLNFPTKGHWRAVSRLKDIEQGLEFLAAHYEDWGIRSLAVPPLGCGHGGLDWSVVGPTLHRHLDRLTIPVALYAPHGTPEPQMQLSFLDEVSEDPKATTGRDGVPAASLALVEILSRITSKRMHPPVGRIKFQKLAYFATAAGVPTQLSFVRNSYGPFAADLKSEISRLVNNGLLEEEQRGRMIAASVGRTFEDARAARRGELDEFEEAIERVADLMMRMDTREAEVAATVHRVASELGDHRAEVPTERDVLDGVLAWKVRRNPPLEPTEVASAVRNLNWLGWIDAKPVDLPLRDDPLLADDSEW